MAGVPLGSAASFPLSSAVFRLPPNADSAEKKKLPKSVLSLRRRRSAGVCVARRSPAVALVLDVKRKKEKRGRGGAEKEKKKEKNVRISAHLVMPSLLSPSLPSVSLDLAMLGGGVVWVQSCLACLRPVGCVRPH